MPARTETSSIDTGSSATRSCGFEHEARGDGDALALAARELVREAVDEELGRRQAGPREGLANALLALVAAAALAVDEQRLLDRRAHPEARVERLVRDPGR